MNQNLIIITGLAGVAVLGVGAYVIATSRNPAEEKVIAKGAPAGATPDNIPSHTNSPTGPSTNPSAAIFEQQKATKLQLLAKYEADLRNATGQADIAAQKMASIEAGAAAACDAYSQTPKWGYRCNGFPVCGINEWWVFDGSEREQGLVNQCAQYVKGFGNIPGSRTLERRANDGPEFQKWQALNERVQGGYRQATEMRDQYAEAKREQQAAQANASRLRQQISDLNAQGVF